MEKLSVVIPFYKYSNYLKDCFKSLRDSVSKDFEVVLVLDNCEEDVSGLIEKYSKYYPINVYKLDGDHGVAAARNLGVKKAKSDYIYFLDSDDYVLDETLGLIISMLDNEDMVYGRVSNTWNKKANYLENLANKENSDEEDDEEEQQLHIQNRRDNFEEYLKEIKEIGTDNLEREMAIYYCLKTKSGLKNVTVLGNAYRKQFLIDNDIWFREDRIDFVDWAYLAQVLIKAQTFISCGEAVYVKRKHNDPINMPALIQGEDDQRFLRRMQGYKDVLEVVPEYSRVRMYFERKLAWFGYTKVSKHLRRSDNPMWKDVYFPAYCETAETVKPETIEGMKGSSQKMIKAYQKHDLEAVLKLVRNRLAKKKLKKIAHLNKNVVYKLFYFHKYMDLPIQENMVMFETFFAKSYADSPKYIYEYLGKNFPGKYNFIWALNEKIELPYGGKTVKRFSLEYAKALATSKYLVFNVRQPLWFRKKEGQVFVETWHGTPLKRLVFDQEEVTSASPKYKKEFFKQRIDWDYLISANDFSTKTFRSCFMYEGEMLDYGYPRNDLMYSPDREQIAADLRKKLNIPEGKKTILYAPTWRDDDHYAKGQYKFTLKLNLQMMKKALGDEYVVILRTHHYIADSIDIDGVEDFVINLSKYDDITEIYLISDICITDYSSVFFDFANLKRPILFYTYDLDKYKNQLRGFYISMQDEVPGPLLFTTEEVIDAVKNINEINGKYSKRYEEFYARFCHLDDGNASRHVVERVFLNKSIEEIKADMKKGK